MLDRIVTERAYCDWEERMDSSFSFVIQPSLISGLRSCGSGYGKENGNEREERRRAVKIHALILVALRDGLRGITFLSRQEPVDWFPDVIFFGFSHDACDRLTGVIEDQRAGDDVAEAEAVESVGICADPTREVNMKFRQGWRNLSTVLGVID